MTSQTHRKALVELITQVVNMPEWQADRDKQTVAFASVFARLFHDNDNTQLILQLAAPDAETANSDEFKHLANKVNARIHRVRDEDNDYVFDQETGALTEKWASDMDDIAHAIAAVMDDAFLPTSEPTVLTKPEHATGTPLINTGKKYQMQTLKFMPRCYAAINAMQAQAYQLNADMQNLRKLPIAIDISKNYAARQIMLKNLAIFKGTFHFRYTLDYRGRAYARSLFVTPQGDSFAKASLDSATKKPLGKHGFAALAIHFANASGHDKLSYTDRIRWAMNEGIEKAISIVHYDGDWRKIAPLIEEHNHAFEEYSAACDFYRAFHATDRKQYLSSIITHQDATNSGFQFGAALTGDRVTAELVNITGDLTKHQAPADLYGKMAENLTTLIEKLSDEYMAQWLPVIDRKFCKKPIMTTGYGAGLNTIMAGSAKKKGSVGILQYMDALATIKPQYTHLVPRTEELRESVEQALDMTASAMLHITETMQKHAERITACGSDIIKWYTPDGLMVVSTKRDNSERQIRLNNGATAYTTSGEVDPLDEDGMARALSPNFIHSIDAQMLRTSALHAAEHDIFFAPIHDSFGTHASTFFELNMLLRRSFVETVQHPWYNNFCEVNHVKPTLPKLGDYQPEEAMQAIYMFS